MDDPWGNALPPATEGMVLESLPTRLAELAGLTGQREIGFDEHWRWPSAEELPEVRALAAERWHPLEEAPLYGCLPAVWPVRHRCWVPDRLPKVSEGYDGTRRWLEPWGEECHRDLDAELAEQAATCGLPAPPRGRLWLLRSPWPSLGTPVVLHLIARLCDERELPVMTDGVTEAARELLGWPENEVWAWWDGPDAEVALSWRARGRVGEEVAPLVLADLGPEEAEGLGEAGLTEDQAVAWCTAVGETGSAAIATIRAWRELGLPADPPDDPGGVLIEISPEKAAAWLEADFGLAAIGELCMLPLESAVAWRDRDFAPAEVGRLLEADWTLTPDEAAAFDTAGIGPDERLRWVEDGFDAASAAAWTETGVLPAEARVWRSLGQGPKYARRYGRPLPPEVVGLTVTAIGGHDRADLRYGVIDPPGTRGRTASRTVRGDRNPWRP